MRIIIISGLSGSGKSIALNALEDENFYCIDNLPISLLSNAQINSMSVMKISLLALMPEPALRLKTSQTHC